LQNHFIAPYLERVCAGEDVLPELHREAGKPGLDWLRQRLFGYAVQHFMVMSEVRQLPGIRNHLTAVTIRKDYK